MDTNEMYLRYSFEPMWLNDDEYKILGHNPDAGKIGVCDSGDRLVMAWTDDKDTAAYIIKCVNSHKDLVEVLENALWHLDSNHNSGKATIRNDELIARIKRILIV